MRRSVWIVGMAVGAVGCGGGVGQGAGSVTGTVGTQTINVRSVGYIEGEDPGTIRIILSDDPDVCQQSQDDTLRVHEHLLSFELTLENAGLPSGDYLEDGTSSSPLMSPIFTEADDQCFPSVYDVPHAAGSVVHLRTALPSNGSRPELSGTFGFDFAPYGRLDGSFNAIFCGQVGSGNLTCQK